MNVDVLIPFYDHAPALATCLQTVLGSVDGATAKITVIDDSLDANERAACAQLCEQFSVTRLVNESNLGFVGTTRRGAAETSGEFILFLNSDTQALEWGWLDKMLSAFADPQVAVVGAKLLFPNGTLQHAGVARTDGGFVFHPFAGEPGNYPPANYFRDDLNGVTGGCLLIRRAVWDELGGWDERFGKGVFEDCDLGWRVRAAGYKIAYQPEAELVHMQSQGLDQNAHPLHSISGPNGAYLRAKHNGIKSDEGLFGLPERTEQQAVQGTAPGTQLTVQFDPSISGKILPLITAAQGGNQLAQALIVDMTGAPTVGARTEMAQNFIDLCYLVTGGKSRGKQSKAAKLVNPITSLPQALPPALAKAQAKVMELNRKAKRDKRPKHRRGVTL
jgi:GT2 family glycosyltransferase